MSKRPTSTVVAPPMRRRAVLVGASSSLVGLALAGCGDDGDAAAGTEGGTSNGASSSSGDTATSGSTAASTTDATMGGSSTSTGSEDTTAGATTDVGSSSTSDGSSDGSSSESGQPQMCDMAGYLAGGTASMAGDYPDPFEAPDRSCDATMAQTCGPCWELGPDRKDVTAGLPGLPMRLSFRVLAEETCAPIEGAVVDVWFCNTDGVYSGEGLSAICYSGDPNAPSLDFMRGRQATNDEGKVDFDSIYPGWYPGRSPHIHVLIVLNGVSHFVTQVYFAEPLSAEIYGQHSDYTQRADNHTANAADGSFDPANPNLLETRKTYDCAMQAWATIYVPATAGGINC